MPKYKVLKAISYKGTRFEAEQEIEMTEEEAQNIGVEYVEKVAEGEQSASSEGSENAAGSEAEGSTSQETDTKPEGSEEAQPEGGEQQEAQQ